MITAEDIYLATDGGKAVILHYYPQAAAGFSSRRNFKLRPDDKNPSGTVFRSSDGHVRRQAAQLEAIAQKIEDAILAE